TPNQKTEKQKMNIPTEFKGKVYFYWEEYCGSLVCSRHPELGGKYIKVGESEDLYIQLSDPRAAIVESLEAQITKERAESQRRIAIMQGRIQELLALEVQP